MTWCYIDDHFPDHPKVMRAGGDAAWLWVCGYCWVQRNLTGGRIPKAAVSSLTDRKRPMVLAKRLVEVGLWEDGGDDFVMHDYGPWNASAEKARAGRDDAKSKRSQAGHTGAMARWSKSTASDSHGESHANRMPIASVSHPGPHPDRIAAASGSHAEGNGFASFGGGKSHANGAHARGFPISPSPNYPSRGKPPGDAPSSASEMEMDQEEPQVTEPEEERWLSLWKGPRRAEAKVIWDRLLVHVAAPFLGQVVGGYCMPPEHRITSPRYLWVTALNQARDQGVLDGDEPVFADLDQEDA